MNNVTKPAKKKVHYAWVIVVGCAMIMFGTAGPIANAIGTFMTPVSEEMGFSMASLSLYFTVMTITMAVVQPFTHKIYDKFDIRVIGAVVTILPAIGMALMSIYTFVAGWYISAVMIGVSFSFVTYTLIPTMMNRWFSKKVGTVIGLALCINGVGGAVFSALAGQFITNLGWRTGYWLVPLIGLCVSLPAAIFLLRSRPEDKGLKPYGYEEGKDSKEKASTAIEVKGFTAKEAYKSPLFYMVVALTVFIFFNGNLQPQITNFAYSVGMTVAQGAIVGSLLMIGNVIGRLVPGILNDRFGVFPAFLFGALGGIVGIVLFLNSAAAAWIPYVGGFFFGFCMSMMAIMPPLLTRAAVGPKDFAKIFGLVAALGTLTSAVAAPTYGAIYDNTGSYFPALTIGLVFLIIGIVIAGILANRAKKKWL